MQKLTKCLLGCALALILLPATSMAQCDAPVLSTCFEGACGNTDPVSTTLTADGSYSVTAGISLCGASGAKVTVIVGNRHYSRILQNGESINFNGAAGDVVTIDATGWKINQNIVCVWAGEIDITLCQNL